MYVCAREILSLKKNGAKICVFRQLYLPLHPQNGKVLYGMLPSNPPGWERSKGSRL